jgi:hypothetical protein
VSDAEELTPLQQDERDALCGDRGAIMRVVSALRGYRARVLRLWNARYNDGFTELGSTVEDVNEIEGSDALFTSTTQEKTK